MTYIKEFIKQNSPKSCKKYYSISLCLLANITSFISLIDIFEIIRFFIFKNIKASKRHILILKYIYSELVCIFKILIPIIIFIMYNYFSFSKGLSCLIIIYLVLITLSYHIKNIFFTKKIRLLNTQRNLILILFNYIQIIVCFSCLDNILFNNNISIFQSILNVLNKSYSQYTNIYEFLIFISKIIVDLIFSVVILSFFTSKKPSIK